MAAYLENTASKYCNGRGCLGLWYSVVFLKYEQKVFEGIGETNFREREMVFEDEVTVDGRDAIERYC